MSICVVVVPFLRFVCVSGLGVSAQRVTPMEGPVFPSVEVVPLQCLARRSVSLECLVHASLAWWMLISDLAWP